MSALFEALSLVQFLFKICMYVVLRSDIFRETIPQIVRNAPLRLSHRTVSPELVPTLPSEDWSSGILGVGSPKRCSDRLTTVVTRITPCGTGSISSVAMGERTQYVRALGAWVSDRKGDCSPRNKLSRRLLDLMRPERTKSERRGGMQAAQIITLSSHLLHISMRTDVRGGTHAAQVS